ncbi:MAG TPA: ice-binding family protein [Anaerolineales bacterium]|nr:ice-binding family protein [Anaerolineales bacterium]
MPKFKFLPILIILMITLSLVAPSLGVSARRLAATTPVSLGTTSNFAILAGSAVNDNNLSQINGDVGLSPAGWGASTGPLTCAEMLSGTVYSVDASGPLPCRVTNASLLTIAKNDLTTAYNEAAARVPANTISSELGGSTLTDGVYTSSAGTFGITGTLILDGANDPNSVFIFKMASSLITASTSKVVLTRGAQACNVWWQVGSSAVLGTNSEFFGTIMADQSITDNGGSTVTGRFLARIAAVTLNNTHITRPLCSPSVTTTLSADSVTVGATVSDSAVLLGDTVNSGGTVTYSVYTDTACTALDQTTGPIAITTPGVLPDSPPLPFNTAGTFYWQAEYSGDANNNSAKSACISEALLVNDVANVTPTLATNLSSTSVAVGSSVYDTATLTGAAASAGGTVTYTYYTDSACTLNAVDAGTKTVTGVGNNVPNSNPMPFNLAGTYYWRAVYSGGTGTNGAVSACNVAAETLTVNKLSPTIATTLSATSVPVGSSVYDTATLSGATATAIGTVTYTVYTNDDTCTLNPQSAGIKNVDGGIVPNSDPISFATAGIYYWQAAYSGDVNNNSAKSACTSEILLVNDVANVTPTLTTNLSATNVVVGSSVYDTATLTGAAASAGGTVTYTYYTDSACTLDPVSAGTKTVTGVGNNVPNSNSMTFNLAGTYYWRAVYSGGTGTNGAVSACNVPAETLTVTATPTPTPTVVPAKVIPAIGFAPYRLTVLPAQPAEKDYASLGDLWLEIPSLGVQTSIVGVPQTNGTWDVSWLGNNAGWLDGSAFPTWSGNSVITAHVYDAYGNPGPFVKLNGLWWGDKIIVHAWGGKYVYEVRSVMQVQPNNLAAMMKHQELSWITLVTCRGYDEASDSYSYRILIRAVLVEVE